MREIAWVKAALKDFGTFPEAVQDRMKNALAIASFGQKADIAKPMKGLGSGVFEIALPYRSDAYRAVYAVQLWVMRSGLFMRSRRNRPRALPRLKRIST
jgi:phage-related protein